MNRWFIGLQLSAGIMMILDQWETVLKSVRTCHPAIETLSSRQDWPEVLYAIKWSHPAVTSIYTSIEGILQGKGD